MHRKLKVGSVLQMNVSNMNMALGGMQPAGLSADFMRYPGAVYRLGRPVRGTGGQPDYEPVKAGPSTNPDRSFIWLPYVPGLITLVPFDRSKSICTGWMSGCWLVRCLVNGVLHFAHIGTAHTAHDPATIKVKNAWKVAVGTGAIRIVSAFQPMCPQAENTMGVLSRHGNFYTIGLSVVVRNIPRAQAKLGGSANVISGPMGGSFRNLRVVAKTRALGQAMLPYAF